MCYVTSIFVIRPLSDDSKADNDNGGNNYGVRLYPLSRCCTQQNSVNGFIWIYS